MRNKPTLYYGTRFTAALCLFTACLLLHAFFNSAHAMTTDGKDLLRFTSGSHILAFSPGSVRLASGDHMLKVDFVGGKTVAPAAKEGTSSDGKTPPLSKVTYPNVWDGVDIVYEKGKHSIVKSTYTVAVGKCAASIRLRYNRPLSIDKTGNLVIRYDNGTMTESKPLAWQVVEGKKKPVMVAYNLYSDKEVGFTVRDYDTNFPLVIDPDLTWNTFFGGTTADYCYAMTMDPSGNIYVTGRTTSQWGTGTYDSANGTDAYAAKLTADGTLLWNIYLGGTSYDYGYGIAVDGSGNVYVTGYSYVTWGTNKLADFHTASGGEIPDVFVAKLTADGAYVWNTFLGGSNEDEANAIAVDGSGNIYVAGYSLKGWDSLYGDPRRAFQGSAPFSNAFVAKLTADGSYVWHTFLGGSASGGAKATAIAVDSSGNAYVTGVSYTAWGAAGDPTPIIGYGGTADYSNAFVARLTTDGVLSWYTFLGENTSGHTGRTIALDGSENIYVAGYTSAQWGTGSYTSGNGADILLAKLTTGGTLLWNVFLGGTGTENVYGLTLDSLGNVYVAGNSNAVWNTTGATGTYTSGHGYDATVAKLASDGTLLWNVFLGGTGGDTGYGVATYGDANVYLAGSSSKTWGPAANYKGGYDGFAAKLPTGNVTLTVTKTGSGSVTSSPTGITCGSTCSKMVTPGTSVTLTAIPEAGSSLPGWTGWGGACSGTNATCTFTVTADTTVTASFALLPYEVTASVTSEGHGTVDPPTQTVLYGNTATINMYPAEHYHIASITDNVVSAAGATGKKKAAASKSKKAAASKTSLKGAVSVRPSAKSPARASAAPLTSPYTITNVTAKHDVAVGFAIDTFTLTVTASGTAVSLGTVSGNGLTCKSGVCTGTYTYGTQVTLTAGTNADGSFGGWSGGCVSTDSTCTVTMTADTAVTATFGSPCAYAFTAPSKPFTYRGGIANVAVKATGTNCASPTIASGDSWLTAAMGTFKNNRGTLRLTVPANTTITERSAPVTIHTDTFNVSQSGAPCALTSVSPASDIQTPSAGSDSFAVKATEGCTWNISTSASWITLAGASGSGAGPVSYNFTANTTAAQRAGTITVSLASAPTKKKVFTVRQSACALTSISPVSDIFTSSGGTDFFTVKATPGCGWNVSSSAEWLTATPVSGGGIDSVSYTAAANTSGKQRTARLTVSLAWGPKVKRVFTVTERK